MEPMTWGQELSCVRAYVKRVYSKATYTNHFMVRAAQRLDPKDRLAVFAEVTDLVKYRMFNALFENGADTVNILMRDSLEVVLTRSPKGDLIVKTVITPTGNRLAHLRANGVKCFKGGKPCS